MKAPGCMRLMSRQSSKMEKQIYSPSSHRQYLKLDIRSPKETWHLEKRKGSKTKTKDTPAFTCETTRETGGSIKGH